MSRSSFGSPASNTEGRLVVAPDGPWVCFGGFLAIGMSVGGAVLSSIFWRVLPFGAFEAGCVLGVFFRGIRVAPGFFEGAGKGSTASVTRPHRVFSVGDNRRFVTSFFG